MARDGDKEAVRGRVDADGVKHGHGLGGGGRFIEKRGVGDGQAGEIGNHGLKIEQRLETALGDLGLIRRVGGVPAGVLEDVALDDRGRGGVVVAEPDEGAEDLVLVHDGAQRLVRGALAPGGGKVKQAAQAEGGRNDGVGELVERLVAEQVQHRLDVLGLRTEMPTRKGVERRKRISQRCFQDFGGSFGRCGRGKSGRGVHCLSVEHCSC